MILGLLMQSFILTPLTRKDMILDNLKASVDLVQFTTGVPEMITILEKYKMECLKELDYIRDFGSNVSSVENWTLRAAKVEATKVREKLQLSPVQLKYPILTTVAIIFGISLKFYSYFSALKVASDLILFLRNEHDFMNKIVNITGMLQGQDFQLRVLTDLQVAYELLRPFRDTGWCCKMQQVQNYHSL